MNLPPYKQYPQIQNSDILLRQIEIADIEKIVQISFYDGIKAEGSIEALNMLKKINLDYQKGDSIHWGIIDIKNNYIVGTCGYYRGFAKNSGELGCILINEFQGKGYMTKALELAIQFGFSNIQLSRVWAATSSNNIKAQHLLKRLGFKNRSKVHEQEIIFEIIRENI